MKNDKIGLITFHNTTNFGSLLQTYGLYKKIEDLGYDVEVIDYTCSKIKEREIPSFPKLDRNFLRRVISYIFFSKKNKEKYDNLSNFLKTKMKLSNKITDKNDLAKLNKYYGSFVCGSDLIWDLSITDNDYSYFLDFGFRDKNLFSFASAGAKWSAEQSSKISSILSKFKNINVRDEGTADRIRKIMLNREINVVCDPTMLLTKNEWFQLVSLNNKLNNYILVYFLDDNDNVIKFTKYLAERTGLKAYIINSGRKISEIENISPSSVEEFLTLVNNADYVVTSSYHGLLFSLYFNKEVWFYNRAHKDRMINLMSKIDIENRELKDNSDYNDLFNQKINYSEINIQIENYRNESLKKLELALKGD